MEIEEIYNYIGASIVNSITEEWKEAKLNIEAYLNEYTELKGEYIDSNSSKKWIDVHTLPFELDKKIYNLMEIMGESNKWNKAVFTLFPSGKFDMEFKWDEERDAERNARLKEYEEKKK